MEHFDDSFLFTVIYLQAVLFLGSPNLFIPEDQRVYAIVAAPAAVFIRVALHAPLPTPWDVIFAAKYSLDGHIGCISFNSDLAEGMVSVLAIDTVLLKDLLGKHLLHLL